MAEFLAMCASTCCARRPGVQAAGHAFYRAANGVWLIGHVPPGSVGLAR